MAASGRSFCRDSAALETAKMLVRRSDSVQAEEFNSPPVVESADTGPFFHNHTVEDLESVDRVLWNTGVPERLIQHRQEIHPSHDQPGPERSGGPGDRGISASPECAREHSFVHLGRRARNHDDDEEDARELAALALAETIDAIEVLSEGALAKTTRRLF